MIPDECKMPDLSDLLDARLQIPTMMHAMIGDPGVTSKERCYRLNFTRLVDRAVREYQAARRTVLDEIAEQKHPAAGIMVLPILAFPDHFETCVSAINRALKLLDRFKRGNLSAAIPREARRSIEAHTPALLDIRDAFEHVDKAIQSEEIGDDQPVMPVIGEPGDRAVIGPYEIPFDHVAITLRRLHEIGQRLFPDQGLSGPA